MISLLNEDNVNVISRLRENESKFKFIYADMIYELTDFSWFEQSKHLLDDGGVFVIQTDYHTVADIKLFAESIGFSLVNWCIYINDWGGVPKRGFPRKHDDILILSADNNFKWYPERIQIPKATAGTALDKKGTGMKTPPDVFYDHPSFSTMSRERVKYGNSNIRWQKPEWLMERLLLPFTDEGDTVLDLFMGTATLGVVCERYNRNYVGVESDSGVFRKAKERLDAIHN